MSPARPASGSVRASTTAKSATGALWMNTFSPVSRQPPPSESPSESPSRCALVLTAARSEPACGSVSAYAQNRTAASSGVR